MTVSAYPLIFEGIDVTPEEVWCDVVNGNITGYTLGDAVHLSIESVQHILPEALAWKDKMLTLVCEIRT